MSPREQVIGLVAWFFNFAFVMPFSVPFFMFPFTFGHLIYGSMVICVAVHVISKIIKGGKSVKND